MCYLYSPQFSCLLFVLCPVIRNSLLRSAYNSSSVFLGPLRTCIATASLTNGSRQGRLTWALESSGLLSHPWDDVLRAILQTQAVQQSWAELASHWHVHCFSCRGSATDTDSYWSTKTTGDPRWHPFHTSPHQCQCRKHLLSTDFLLASTLCSKLTNHNIWKVSQTPCIQV